MESLIKTLILMSVRTVAINEKETSDISMACLCVYPHGHASHGCSGRGHFPQGEILHNTCVVVMVS